MSEPINKKMYNKVKEEAKKKFKRFPSLYASAWIQKEYKKQGGKYSGKKPNKTKFPGVKFGNNVLIGKNVKIGKSTIIGSNTIIEQNVLIGKNVKIYPNVYIGDNVSIGNNCLIFSGVKIYSETEIVDGTAPSGAPAGPRAGSVRRSG